MTLSDINQLKTESLRKSGECLKGHQTRLEYTLSKEWEKGGDLNNRDEKWCAKDSLMKELELGAPGRIWPKYKIVGLYYFLVLS